MPVILKEEEEEQNLVPFSNMKDGQIGEIKVSPVVNHIGSIVQRHGDKVITIGKSSSSAWSHGSSVSTIFVRILEDGESLVVFNNEQRMSDD